MLMPAGKRLRPMQRQPRCGNRNCINTSFVLPDVAEVWRRGSVIASWLLDLTATELLKEPSLKATRDAYQIRARGAGRSRPLLMKRFLPVF